MVAAQACAPEANVLTQPAAAPGAVPMLAVAPVTLISSENPYLPLTVPSPLNVLGMKDPEYFTDAPGGIEPTVPGQSTVTFAVGLLVTVTLFNCVSPVFEISPEKNIFTTAIPDCKASCVPWAGAFG